MPSPGSRAFAAVRRTGWRAPALAALSYVPLVVTSAVAGGVLVFFGLALHMIVLVALARCLGAWRPDGVPPPASVGDDGARVAQPARRPADPVSNVDRMPGVALRNAGKLWRAAVSVTGLYVLAIVAAYLTLVALSGGRLADYGATAQSLLSLPVSALFMAFVLLALQRVALEGDPRVLVAAAHSLRIARSAYGWLLALAIAEPAVATLALLAIGGADAHPSPARIAVVGTSTVVLATVVKVTVMAVANELYLAGPRLDLPAELSHL